MRWSLGSKLGHEENDPWQEAQDESCMDREESSKREMSSQRRNICLLPLFDKKRCTDIIQLDGCDGVENLWCSRYYTLDLKVHSKAMRPPPHASCSVLVTWTSVQEWRSYLRSQKERVAWPRWARGIVWIHLHSTFLWEKADFLRDCLYWLDPIQPEVPRSSKHFLHC